MALFKINRIGIDELPDSIPHEKYNPNPFENETTKLPLENCQVY